ncbi:MAG: LCP family protein [Clostridiaceae bacterium]|nr:LCP family protein [Clostridiaceae bacterium]
MKKLSFYKQPWFAAMAIVMVFVLILSFSVNALWQGTFGRINRIEANTLNDNFDRKEIEVIEKEILENPIPYDKEITNILLLGVDSRDKKEVNTRSDAMLILTIDQKQGKLKLTSLQRDMLVPMPDREMDKLTHANVYGGPEYVMEIVNNILRLKIERFVLVNIRSLEIIIDMIGGVELDVPAEAVPFLDKIIREQNNVFSDTPPSPYITSPGLQTVNGRQGVAFARNRSTQGSDYDRMDYQKQLIQAIFSKFLDLDFTSKLSVFQEGLGYVTTNLTENELLGMLQSVLPLVDEEIETLTIPVEGYHNHYDGEIWLNLCDFNGMIPIVQKFIFGEEFPFDPVPEIPGAPNSVESIEEQPVYDWVTEPEDYQIDHYTEPTRYDMPNYGYEPNYGYDPNYGFDSNQNIPTPDPTYSETSPVDPDFQATIPNENFEPQPTVPEAIPDISVPELPAESP